MNGLISLRDFTHGEASPQYTSRTDLEYYEKSASYIKNMMVKPNGSVISRFGFQYLINDGGYKIAPFFYKSFTSTYHYLVSFTTSFVNFYLSDTNGNLTLSYTKTITNPMIDFQIVRNRLIIVSLGPTIYFEMSDAGVIGDAGDYFAENADTLSPVPTRIYDTTYFASEFQLSDTEVGAGKTLTITNLVAPFAGFTNNYIGGEFSSLGSTTSDTIGTAIITGVTSATVATVQIMTDFKSITSTNSDNVYTDTGDGTTTQFSIPFAINSANDIIVYVNNLIVTDYTVIDIETSVFTLSFTTAPLNGDVILVRKKSIGTYQGTQCTLSEQAFSTLRGWPQSVTFFEDRIYFSGCPSCPLSFFGSNVGAYNNFSLGTGLDSQGISSTIDQQGDEIIHIIGGRSLFIFTKYAEYASQLSTGQPLTPTNISCVKLQSSNGTNTCKPVNFEEQIVYAKRSGNAIMALQLADYQYTYTSKNISFYSSHLINNPIEITPYVYNPKIDGNLLFIINEDFSLTLYQSLVDQNVSAFTRIESNTLYETDIKFKSICFLNDFVYVLCTNIYGGDTFISKLDFNIPLDSFKLGENLTMTDYQIDVGLSSTVSIIKLDPSYNSFIYIGEAIANVGIIYVQSLFEPLGITTLDNLYFGYSFEQRLKTMPLHIITQNGDNRYLKKNTSKVYIEFYNSYTFQIGVDSFDLQKAQEQNPYPYTFYGVQIPMQNLATTNQIGWGNEAITYASGVYDYSLNNGFKPTISVTCLQTLPLPIEILRLDVEITI